MAKLWTRSSLARPPSWHENRKPIGAFCGVLRRFQAPFSCRPTTDTPEGETAPQTPLYGLVGLFRGHTIYPRYGALETLHASTRRPARPGQTPPERTQPPPTRHPEPAPKREKPPRRHAAALRGPESRESRKSRKVVSRKSKVDWESRKVDRESRKPPEKSRKSLVFSKSEVVTNAEMPLRAAVSDSKGHFSSKS